MTVSRQSLLALTLGVKFTDIMWATLSERVVGMLMVVAAAVVFLYYSGCNAHAHTHTKSKNRYGDNVDCTLV